MAGFIRYSIDWTVKGHKSRTKPRNKESFLMAPPYWGYLCLILIGFRSACQSRSGAGKKIQKKRCAGYILPGQSGGTRRLFTYSSSRASIENTAKPTTAVDATINFFFGDTGDSDDVG